MRPLYKMVSLMGVEPITKRFWAVRVLPIAPQTHKMVRVIGLEPIKCCHHSALNATRLPVSPHTHILDGGPGRDWATDKRILSPPLYLWVIGLNGACNATWTHDLTRTKGVLYQLSYTSIGAGDGGRTRAIRLGKAAFYQLNYSCKNGGEWWSCTTRARRQRVYSPPRY